MTNVLQKDSEAPIEPGGPTKARKRIAIVVAGIVAAVAIGVGVGIAANDSGGASDEPLVPFVTTGQPYNPGDS